MNQQTSMTALMSAFGRAYHSANEKDPIFYDGHARSLFSDDEYSFVRKCLLSGKDFFASDLSSAGEEDILRRIVNDAIAPTPLCRAAFCEDALATAEKTGTVQYVILGAGLDTFAFRNAQFLSKHSVWEVDLPSTQTDKLRRIARAGWFLPQNLRFVGMDFSKDRLSEHLLAAGFSPDKKTFFSWLGVSYYLTVEQIDNVFSQLSSLCSDGSSLVFDYADQDLFDAPEKRVQNMIALACSCGEPMKSCFSRFELIKLLEQHNFLVYEDLTPESIQASIINRHVSSMKAFEHIHYILAVKKGTPVRPSRH